MAAMTVEEALAAVEAAALWCIGKSAHGSDLNLRQALATLRDAAADAAKMREFVRDCADGLPEWRPGGCRKRAIALLTALAPKEK